MRQRIRLTESDLHMIIRESVNRILRESANDYDYFFVIPNYDYDQDEPWEEKYGVIETDNGLEIYNAEDDSFVCLLRGRSLSDYKTGPDMAGTDMSNIDDDMLINDMSQNL